MRPPVPRCHSLCVIQFIKYLLKIKILSPKWLHMAWKTLYDLNSIFLLITTCFSFLWLKPYDTPCSSSTVLFLASFVFSCPLYFLLSEKSSKISLYPIKFFLSLKYHLWPLLRSLLFNSSYSCHHTSGLDFPRALFKCFSPHIPQSYFIIISPHTHMP